MRTLRRRCRSASGSDGLTLVELTVTMLITSILAVTVSALFMGLMKQVSFTNRTQDTTAEARVAVEAITQTLRAAVPSGPDTVAVTVAQASSISFYASLDRTGGASVTTVLPSLVTFAWNGSSCVTRTIVDGSNVSSSLCVLRSTTAPTFAYYDSATGTTPLTVGAGLSLAARHTIDSVQVVLNATAVSSGRTGTTTVDDRVTLANCVTQAC